MTRVVAAPQQKKKKKKGKYDKFFEGSNEACILRSKYFAHMHVHLRHDLTLV